MTHQKCSIPNCPELADGHTTPALCAAHLDLDVLIDFTLSHDEPATVENITKYYLMGRQNTNYWSLTPEQIPEQLPAVLAAIYQTEAQK